MTYEWNCCLLKPTVECVSGDKHTIPYLHVRNQMWGNQYCEILHSRKIFFVLKYLLHSLNILVWIERNPSTRLSTSMPAMGFHPVLLQTIQVHQKVLQGISCCSVCLALQGIRNLKLNPIEHTEALSVVHWKGSDGYDRLFNCKFL